MNPPLIITIKNNLRLSHVPPAMLTVLMEKLQFANPKWVENDRMRRWNRGTPKTLKFFDRIGKTGLWIPRGYIRQLIDLCKRDDTPFQIDDQRRSLANVNFAFNGRLKPFQQEAVKQMLTKNFGSLSSATGSGKTVMALYIIAQRQQSALIVVHTRDLAAQWVERIGAFLGIPPEDIGMIGGGKKTIGEKITVALVQSLYKCAEDISEKIGFVVVDECHRCPSRTFTEAVSSFDSKYMLGLSATPWRRDNLSRLIFWHLGDVQHEVDKKHLVETGAVLKAEVIVRETNFKPYYDPVNEYSKMLSELTADTDRNILIAGDVARESQTSPGICLVLSDRKIHCENLQVLLRLRFKIESSLLTGDLSMTEREAVVEALNRGQVKILVATGQLVGEGFDCKDLSTLFLATPIRFSGRVLQYLGRILRPDGGKKMARVFDYVDVHVETLRRAAQARQRVYRR
jgi:superfamily II DNA or RNA helicase